MATISSIGVGSGLDAEAIITKLLQIERQPINQLQTAASAIEAKISSFGKIQSYLDALNSASDTLRSSTTWKATSATSSDTSAVSATSSDGSAAGSYSVSVTQLAKAQMTASAPLGSKTSTVGAGTLSFDIGTWNADQTTFTASGSTVTIDIDADDTLEDVRNKINANDDVGVTASIVSDANGARLVFQSASSGRANGFRIGVADDDGEDADAAGLSRLAFDPASGSSQMTRTQAAQNAAGTINGLAVESDTNTFDDVIDGVSLTFSAPTTSPATVTVASNTESMRTAVTSFVNAYNTLQGYIKDQTKYVEGAKSGSTLQGDRTAIGLQLQLRGLLGGSSSASGAFARASDIGLDVQKDGSIKVVTAKLTQALSDPAELGRFFNADGATAAADGLAERVANLADNWLDTEGSLTSRQDGLKRLLDVNADRQDAMETRLLATEKRLRAQYTALDTKMAGLTNLNQYISQQITNWNKS